MKVKIEVEVSIHAPYIGSDGGLEMDVADFGVSIHAPYIGSDKQYRRTRVKSKVSIHAPYIGSDMVRFAKHYYTKRFNPRSLHRERLGAAYQVAYAQGFQSTLPT